MIAASAATERGIARWKAQEARRAAVASLDAAIKRIEQTAAREGVEGAAARMLEAAALRLVKPTSTATYTSVERRICRALRVPVEEVRAPSRKRRKVTIARQAIMYWTARLTTLSPGEIGRRMGGRNHSTVYFGINAYPKKRAATGRNLPPIPRLGQFKGSR